MAKQTLYQTSRYFNTGIQESGSEFLCLYFVSKKTYNYYELNDIWDYLVGSGAIVSGEIKNQAAVLSALGISAEYKGIISPVTDFIVKGQFAIARMAGTELFYVCVDRNKERIYSPNPESAVSKRGTYLNLLLYEYV